MLFGLIWFARFLRRAVSRHLGAARIYYFALGKTDGTYISIYLSDHVGTLNHYKRRGVLRVGRRDRRASRCRFPLDRIGDVCARHRVSVPRFLPACGCVDSGSKSSSCPHSRSRRALIAVLSSPCSLEASEDRTARLLDSLQRLGAAGDGIEQRLWRRRR